MLRVRDLEQMIIRRRRLLPQGQQISLPHRKGVKPIGNSAIGKGLPILWVKGVRPSYAETSHLDYGGSLPRFSVLPLLIIAAHSRAKTLKTRRLNLKRARKYHAHFLIHFSRCRPRCDTRRKPQRSRPMSEMRKAEGKQQGICKARFSVEEKSGKKVDRRARRSTPSWSDSRAAQKICKSAIEVAVVFVKGRS